MIRAILYKWFGLTESPCESCEILRERLHSSEAERKDLLARLLDRGKPNPVVEKPVEKFEPILPQYVPWRVKQQMLEAEDRKKAELLRQKNAEIESLEKELGVKDA